MYLGIDIITASVKALRVDELQNTVTSATYGLEVSRLRPGWSEQQPRRGWLAHVEKIKAHRPGAID